MSGIVYSKKLKKKDLIVMLVKCPHCDKVQQTILSLVKCSFCNQEFEAKKNFIKETDD